MKKVFITGADGYIGSRLVQQLTKKYKVEKILLDGKDKELSLNLERPEEFRFDVIKKSDVIIHLAAISSPDKCAKEYEKSYRINVTGTKYFISECLRRGAGVLFFSSDVVYGPSNFEGKDYFNENSDCHPLGEYGDMKREVEKSFQGKDNFKIFRLSYVYSKNDKFTKYLNSCCEKGEVADVFHPFSRNVVYIGDILSAVDQLIEKWEDTKESIFNLVGPETISRKKMAELYQKDVDSRLQFKISEPEEIFFNNRPKAVRVKSLHLEKLLGKPPTELSQAYKQENDKNLLNN